MNGGLKKMQWLILSKPERERLHPVNVALFFIGMIMIPFVLTHDQAIIVVYHLLLFLFVQERTVFRYLLLPALYAIMMCVPLLYGASIDPLSIYETTIQVTLFVTSSQWIFTLVRLDQMGPLFRFLPRLTRLTGMVLALIPSFLRTWPEVKMSHPQKSLAVRLERMAAYHIIPIEAAPSRLRSVTRRDVQTGVLLTTGLMLCFTPWSIISALLLPISLLFTKGGIRDAYHVYRHRSRRAIATTGK